MCISIIAIKYKEEKIPRVELLPAIRFVYLPCLPPRRAGSARISEGPAVLAVACNIKSGPKNEGKTAGTRVRWAPATVAASCGVGFHNLVYIWLIAPRLRPAMVAACATVLGGGRGETSPNVPMGGRVGYHEISVRVVGRDLSPVVEVFIPCNRGWVRVFSAAAAGWVGEETIQGALAPEARHD